MRTAFAILSFHFATRPGGSGASRCSTCLTSSNPAAGTMLELFYSNRHETLSRALLDDLAAFAMNNGDPFERQAIIVPSAAVRRRLELDMATRFGICANMEFSYLAQWLW
ncbi:exodeoxyribonuclease V subunit gamma, partial [Caballeronia sp.]|uniref:exodeoxyribonuclease V subunit gamma n=1 Tax=Caballeronia sp. TaxID=1931223 RepID=UPI003C5DB2F8